MVFSSIAFLGLFFPIVFALYHLTPARFKNGMLALASLVFYAWGEPKFVVIMLLSVAFNHQAARFLHRSRHPNLILGLAVSVNLLLLGIFKYAAFAVENFNWLSTWWGGHALTIWTIALPIGISFYTFHAISYLIDIHRGNAAPTRSIVDYALYILLFPQLIAGPIIRYKDIHQQIAQRSCSLTDMREGVTRFIIGLGKKVLIANQMGLLADVAFGAPAQDLDMATAWIGLVCYSLQIYFDFSGYSDMAIGLARMFGFRFPENFNLPYTATSVQDFWRRWHISLSTWFRDYVYIPLGGNRGSAFRTYLNLWCVFLLTGIWHGASWNFVIWGALHGAALTLERLIHSRLAPWSGVLQRLYTLLVVMLAWVFFRCDTLAQAIDYLGALFTPAPHPGFMLGRDQALSGYALVVLVVALIMALGLHQTLWRRWGNALSAHWPPGPLRIAQALLLEVVLLLAILSMALGQYNPFIYFRF